MSNEFGLLFRTYRLAKEETLRSFCELYGYDPSYVSKIERGLTVPKNDEKLHKFADSLGLYADDQRQHFFDLANTTARIIPGDLDDEVVQQLPLVFRTLRNERPTREQLKKLAEKIRDSLEPTNE